MVAGERVTAAAQEFVTWMDAEICLNLGAVSRSGAERQPGASSIRMPHVTWYPQETVACPFLRLLFDCSTCIDWAI